MSGILGTANLVANTNTTVYPIPSGKLSTMSVNFCNRNAIGVRVRLAIAASGTPTAAEWQEYDAYIPPNGVLERTQLLGGSTNNVVAFASNDSVSVVVSGFEE